MAYDPTRDLYAASPQWMPMGDDQQQAPDATPLVDALRRRRMSQQQGSPDAYSNILGPSIDKSMQGSMGGGGMKSL
jgi:hypothetical protein